MCRIMVALLALVWVAGVCGEAATPGSTPRDQATPGPGLRHAPQTPATQDRLASTRNREDHPLFDGESLSGWTQVGGKPGNWAVEGGMLVCRGDGKDWLSTNRAYADFILGLEYKVGRAGNSGVLIRAPHKGDPSFDGMEIQILDDEAPAYRSLKPDQCTGSVYGVSAARRGVTRKAGEWNAMTIRAVGSKVTVEINGTVVVDDDMARHPESLARHPGLGRTKGFIGLQSHGDSVQFREVWIKEIR